MNAAVVNGLFSLYGNGFIQSFYTVMERVLDAAISVLDTEFFSLFFNAFSGIVASLIIIYFYIDMIEDLSREMFSMERLMSGFIRLFICIMFCVCSFQICQLILDFAKSLLVATGSFFTNMSNGTNMVLLLPHDKDAFLEAMDGVFPEGARYTDEGRVRTIVRQVRYLTEHPLWAIESFIIMVMAGVLNLIGYFIAVSTAITLIVRMYFAPIGVANLFRGANSSGIRYFKSLLSTACTFAAMLAIVGAASLLSQQLINSDFFGTLGLSEDYQSVTGYLEPVQYYEGFYGNSTRKKTGYVGKYTNEFYEADEVDSGYAVSSTVIFSIDFLDENNSILQSIMDKNGIYLSDQLEELSEDAYVQEMASAYSTADSIGRKLTKSDDCYDELKSFFDKYKSELEEFYNKENSSFKFSNFPTDIATVKKDVLNTILAEVNKNSDVYKAANNILGIQNNITQVVALSKSDVDTLIDYWETYCNDNNIKKEKKCNILEFDQDAIDLIIDYTSSIPGVDTSADSYDSYDDVRENDEEAQAKLKEYYSERITLALNFKTVILTLIPQIAAVVGMAGASRIVHDAFE